MNRSDVEQQIMTKLGWSGTEALRRVKKAVDPACKILSRKPGIPWGMKADTFSLTSGTSSYTIGKDILTKYADLRGIVELWHTDVADEEVKVWTVSRFNSYARGRNTEGRPHWATLHSDYKTFEVFPIPDDSYTLWVMLRVAVNGLDDIPDIFHDLVINQCVMMLAPAGTDAYIEAKDALKSGLKEAASETLTRWQGDSIEAKYYLGVSRSSRRQVDSLNKLGLGCENYLFLYF